LFAETRKRGRSLEIVDGGDTSDLELGRGFENSRESVSEPKLYIHERRLWKEPKQQIPA
jgi:hypothetical protein